MLVDRLLTQTAGRWPDLTALVAGADRLSFAELDRTVDRAAAGMRSLGVRRGDRVIVYLDNGIEAVVSLLGALRAGAVFVPVNPTTKGEKLGFLLRDSGAVLLIADRRAESAVADALRCAGGGQPRVVFGGRKPDLSSEVPSDTTLDALFAAEPSARADQPIDLDLAALIYTSGSTGRPKGVMMSHRSIVSATTSINGYLENSPEDRILNVLPLSFDYGLYQLFLAAQSGASVILERSFAFPSVMLDLMVRDGVTALPIVPMIAALLLKYDLAGYDLSALRYISNTGAVLPAAHIDGLRRQLPAVRIFSMYGLTECKRVAYLSPEEIDERPMSVGKPMDNVEVYVRTSDGQLATSGTGELVVRGSNVMDGYWHDTDATSRVLQPGLLPGERVLATGDIFQIDDDGYLYFQGRTDDIIKSRGQKVSPREVEQVLHAAPAVSEAVVVSVADALTGEALKAYVTLRHGVNATEQEILQHCARHLEDFMVPKLVEIVSSLPRTASGKIARRDLLSGAVN